MILRLLLIGVAVGAIALLHDHPRATHNVRSQPMVPDARFVKFASKPVHSMVTDLYWIRMVNMSANSRLPWEGKQLIKYGDFVTDLEPTFFYAYMVGGLLGTVDVGQETYNVDEAIAFLEKGITNLPDEPRLAIYQSFLWLELKKNPAAAAATLERAAKSPRAPPFVGQLATRLYASVGNFDAASNFAQTISANADPETRQFFETRLREIDQEKLLSEIDTAVKTFTEKEGRAPETIDELVSKGLLPGMPLDPLGGTIALTPEGAKASSRPKRLRPNISLSE